MVNTIRLLRHSGLAALSLLMRASTLAAAVLIAGQSWAHHSDTGIDVDSTVIVEGTITEFVWRNPHIYFKVDATTSSDKTGEWEFQMAATAILGRAGWTRDSLQPGDSVVVRGHPAFDGRRYGVLQTIEKDGVVMTTRGGATTETASTDSIEGNMAGRPLNYRRLHRVF